MMNTWSMGRTPQNDNRKRPHQDVEGTWTDDEVNRTLERRTKKMRVSGADLDSSPALFETSAEDRVSLTTIPPELHGEIFNYFEVDDLLMISTVSPKFKIALSAQSLWARALKREHAPAQPDGLNISSKDWAALLFPKLYRRDGISLGRNLRGYVEETALLIRERLSSAGITAASNWEAECNHWLSDQLFQITYNTEEKIKSLFIALYRTFANTLPRPKWPQLPLIGDLIAMSEYYQIVRANRYSPVLDTAIFSHFSIVGVVEKWNREMKEEILWHAWDASRDDCKTGKEVEDKDTDRRLEQLSVAFECPRCDTVLFGWNDISTHWCCYFEGSRSKVVLPSSESKIQLCATRFPRQIIYLGSRVKESLLKVPKWVFIAGREGMTVQDMDANAPTCVFRYTKNGGRSQLLVLNWRQYASHVAQNCLGDLEAQDFDLRLTVSEGMKNEMHWHCGHCHTGVARKYDQCCQHLIESHGIVEPQTPEDLYFWDRLSTHNRFLL